MDASTKRLERVETDPVRKVEILTFHLGFTSIVREVFPDGSKGNVRITTGEAQDVLGERIYDTRYIFVDGKLVLDPVYQDDEDVRAPFFRRLLLVLKLLLNVSEAPVPDEYAEIEN